MLRPFLGAKSIVLDGIEARFVYPPGDGIVFILITLIGIQSKYMLDVIVRIKAAIIDISLARFPIKVKSLTGISAWICNKTEKVTHLISPF
jgi:hypothetical protein